MMITNKLVLRWSLIMLAILGPLIYAGYLHFLRSHFSCEAHTTIVDDKYVVDTIMDYTFRGDSGTLESSGEYIRVNAQPVAVSNKISFNVWQENGEMVLISNETNELPKKAEAYRLTIPDFYHARDRGLRFQLTPANASSYFFIYANSPIFYCTKG